MLVLDGPAILVAHVAEDVCRSLVDFLCRQPHNQCQSIQSDSESGHSSQVTQQISHVRTAIASVSEQVSLVSAVRYRCTRTSRHFQSVIESRIVSHGLQVGGAQS